jgi:hypothetical protein
VLAGRAQESPHQRRVERAGPEPEFGIHDEREFPEVSLGDSYVAPCAPLVDLQPNLVVVVGDLPLQRLVRQQTQVPVDFSSSIVNFEIVGGIRTPAK